MLFGSARRFMDVLFGSVCLSPYAKRWHVCVIDMPACYGWFQDTVFPNGVLFPVLLIFFALLLVDHFFIIYRYYILHCVCWIYCSTCDKASSCVLLSAFSVCPALHVSLLLYACIFLCLSVYFVPFILFLYDSTLGLHFLFVQCVFYYYFIWEILVLWTLIISVFPMPSDTCLLCVCRYILYLICSLYVWMCLFWCVCWWKTLFVCLFVCLFVGFPVLYMCSYVCA